MGGRREEVEAVDEVEGRQAVEKSEYVEAYGVEGCEFVDVH
ncbi:hypothetical protein FACS189472_18550 [Alphaproteobacteria bacterium]|nr:hypothetical protein FACS189472_18550 [Alphaproteobacteria bacterium]